MTAAAGRLLEQQRRAILRRRLAMMLRERGFTFRSVGEQLDPPISPAGARQLVLLGQREGGVGALTDMLTVLGPVGSGGKGLTILTQHALRDEYGSVAAGIEAFRVGPVRHDGCRVYVAGRYVRNVGKKGAEAIMAIAGATWEPSVPKPPPRTNSVSLAIALLRRKGYTVVAPVGAGEAEGKS